MNYPKKLSRDSALMLKHLITLMGENPHIKINNADHDKTGIMAVCVEHMATFPKTPFGENVRIYSVAHYYESNGDLMADPLMEFAYASENEGFYPSIYPCFFQQDGIFATRRQSILFDEDGEATFNRREQHDQTAFANIWMRNIKLQQFPDLKFPLSPEEKAIRTERKSYKSLLKQYAEQ